MNKTTVGRIVFGPPLNGEPAIYHTEDAKNDARIKELEAESAKLQIELSTLRGVRGELERNNGHLHEELFKSQNENSELKKKLYETEALLNAALVGQSNYMSEAEELRKRLECPPITFDGSISRHKIISFYYQKDSDGIWRASGRSAIQLGPILYAKSKQKIKDAIERYSNELWDKLHEAKNDKRRS